MPESLVRYLNTHSIDDTYSRIILYLLMNRAKVRKCSIGTLADACFVSPATITRFTHRLGYSSFVELKNDFSNSTAADLEVPFQIDSRKAPQIAEHPDAFLQRYGESIVNTINHSMESIDVAESLGLIDQIERYQRIFLFGYDSILEYLRRFQSSLMLCDKCALVATSGGQAELATHLMANDLCVIVTSFGGFFSQCADAFAIIRNSPARKVLLTQNAGLMASVSVDQTIQIARRPNPQAGSFNMEFFLEYIARVLFSRYIATKDN